MQRSALQTHRHVGTNLWLCKSSDAVLQQCTYSNKCELAFEAERPGGTRMRTRGSAREVRTQNLYLGCGIAAYHPTQSTASPSKRSAEQNPKEEAALRGHSSRHSHSLVGIRSPPSRPREKEKERERESRERAERESRARERERRKSHETETNTNHLVCCFSAGVLRHVTVA